jgi:frataxin-like iron-binding protein CyaY
VLIGYSLSIYPLLSLWLALAAGGYHFTSRMPVQ